MKYAILALILSSPVLADEEKMEVGQDEVPQETVKVDVEEDTDETRVSLPEIHIQPTRLPASFRGGGRNIR